MPQIIFLIIALIIKFAVESAKAEQKKQKSSIANKPKNYSVFTKKGIYDEVIHEVKKEMPEMEKQITDMMENEEDMERMDLGKTKIYHDVFEEPKNFVSAKDRMMFMLLTMIYVMYEDDGEFSRKERKMVSTIMKVTTKRFSKRDQEEMKDLLDTRPNLDLLFLKVDQMGMEYEEVLKIVKELRHSLKKQPQYENIFVRIENRVTYEL